VLVDCHEMLGKRRLCNECIMDESLASFAEDSIMHISLPDVEYFCNGIILEELNVRDDIEHRRFVHPIRKGNHLCAGITVPESYLEVQGQKIRFLTNKNYFNGN